MLDVAGSGYWICAQEPLYACEGEMNEAKGKQCHGQTKALGGKS